MGFITSFLQRLRLKKRTEYNPKILETDFAKAQAEWQALLKKLRKIIKDYSRRAKMEAWGTQHFDSLRSLFRRTEEIISDSRPPASSAGSDHINKLDKEIEAFSEKIEALEEEFLPRKLLTQEKLWQKKVLNFVERHLSQLRETINSLEEKTERE